jgi:hypothetical protein
MVAITALRSSIAAAVANPSVWQVFAFPPATVLANSVVIQPNDPYIEPQNNQWNTISPLANFKISVIVPMYDNQGNLADIESYLVQLFNLLSASSISFRIGTVSAPAVLPVDAGQMLAADITVSVLTSWS